MHLLDSSSRVVTTSAFWPHPSQDAFPVRDELLSDLSDDEPQVEKVTEVLKPTIISFKHKDDTDLFGLGILDEAPAARDSSEDQEGKTKNIPDTHTIKEINFLIPLSEKESKQPFKEKKKKKKKSKEVRICFLCILMHHM